MLLSLVTAYQNKEKKDNVAHVPLIVDIEDQS